MDKITAKANEGRMISESESALDQLIREGARKMLQAALAYEIAKFLEKMKGRKTEEGWREIVRNGGALGFLKESWRKSIPKSANNVVGFIKQPTFWTSCSRTLSRML